MDEPSKPLPFSTSISRWFFAACIILVLYGAFLLVEAYLIPIFLALATVVVAAPLYEFSQRLLGGRNRLASALTCLILLFIIVLPMFWLVGMLTGQALELYTTVSQQVTGTEFQENFNRGLGRVAPLVDFLQEKLGLDQQEILAQIGEAVRRVSAMLYSNLTDILKGVTSVIVGFALYLFVTYYLFTDGSRWAAKALSLSPLPAETNAGIKQEVLDSLRATMKGTVVLALMQGIAGGLGFLAFGAPKALFWGTVMVVVSVVPIIGTALVWLPAGIYLIVHDAVGPGIGVMIWCLVAAVVLDNIVRPRLIGGKAKLHPLFTLFSVLGGLSVFGLVGLILGPLILALLLSLVGVYESHFLARPQAPADPPDKV